MLRATGETAAVHGISSGAFVALEAARQGLPIRRLSVFEPPFIVDGSRPLPPADLDRRIEDLVARGRRSGAVRLFLRRGPGLPAPVVALLRLRAGVWSPMTASAHTLPYDIAAVRDGQRGVPLAAGDWASVTQPVQVLTGGRSPAWTHTAMRSLADALPDARHRVLDGQRHVVDGAAVAPPLTAFLRES